MRKIERGSGPGGSSEWILEEKGQPHGKCQGPEWESQAWCSLGRKNKKAGARGWGGWAGLQEKIGDKEERLQTPRGEGGRPPSAARERCGCHQCTDGI